MDSTAPNIIVNPEKFELVLHANEDCTFELTNVGYEAIIYRVRTTAPLRYYLKHSKGVIKGNASAKITIFLNPKTFAEGLEPGTRSTKDTFRVDCAVLGEGDVVEAHGANLANLLEKKKDANAASVVQKYITCRVLLQTDDASGEGATAGSGKGSATVGGDGGAGGRSLAGGTSDAAGRGGSSTGKPSAGRKGMTAEQLEENTLKEKYRRSDMRESRVATASKSTGITRIIIVAAVVLVFAWWLMRSGGGSAEDGGAMEGTFV